MDGKCCFVDRKVIYWNFTTAAFDKEQNEKVFPMEWAMVNPFFFHLVSSNTPLRIFVFRVTASFPPFPEGKWEK
jgi:hypothetical protein